MNLSRAPASYDALDQSSMRAAIARADTENFKKGRDVVMATGQRLVIPDEATGQLYRLKVSGGVLSIVAYP